MSLPVILRRAAQCEFDTAADWYEARQAGRGVAFTAAVGRVLARIAAQPELYAPVQDDIREALVSGYPFAIYYRAEPTQIVVLAVFHTSRDPNEWQGRA
ncbi:MAG: type II toxin-antitoxin system RelE/ParE family toxin [Gemmataceae bacterium]